MDAATITDVVRSVVPDATVHPTALAGDDHWFCVVVAASFEGQRPLARQRRVLQAFGPQFASGSIHALDLRCLTPAELEARGMPAPFAPHGRGEGQHPQAW